jgi:hypothetical protein
MYHDFKSLNAPKGVYEMHQFVGVENAWNLSTRNLKWQALVFDRIAAFYLHFVFESGPAEIGQCQLAELHWLTEHEFLFEPDFPGTVAKVMELSSNEEFAKAWEEATQTLKRMDRRRVSSLRDSVSFIVDWAQSEYLLTRLATIQLNSEGVFTAVPLSTLRERSASLYKPGDCRVVEIVLNRIPQPDDTVAWEQIFDFRRDPDSKGKFWGLRTWMSEIGRMSLTPREITEKLEWSLYEYERHMKLHRMKVNWGVLRSLVSVGAGMAEDLVKFKWSHAAELLFSFKDRRIALLEAESSAPGREVAYIASAREEFDTVPR